MQRFFLLIAIFSFAGGHAQLNESFADGDFTSNPTWAGTPGWQVVVSSDVAGGATNSYTLRLNAPATNGTEYLSTRLPGSWGIQQSWGFWLGRRAQGATAANVSYVWLYASEADVTSATVSGYRIRFGDDLASGDKIVLESVTNGVAASVISSAGAVTNGLTHFGFLVRVTRDAGGLWTLYTSVLPAASGTGALATDLPDPPNTAVRQGSATNNSIASFDQGYVALAAAHSTGAAARTGAEFDQILVSLASGASLPVTWGYVRLAETAAGIRLSWNNLSETGIMCYTPERSVDGERFLPLSSLPAWNNGHEMAYEYLDPHPTGSLAFYRIAATEANGRRLCSPMLKTTGNKEPKAFRLYPNPLKGRALQLEAGALLSGDYAYSIYSHTGQIVYHKKIKHPGGSLSESLVLPPLAPGAYHFSICGPIRLERKFVVQ